MEITIRSQVDARKERLGETYALLLASKAREVIVAKGKKVVRFDTQEALKQPTDLVAAMLGPTGNLRAPTILKGQRLLVGFNEDAYAETFE